MSDLKLLDELLIDYMRTRHLQPADLEQGMHSTGVTVEIMSRLRQAYRSGETLTLTWVRYFDPDRAERLFDRAPADPAKA